MVLFKVWTCLVAEIGNKTQRLAVLSNMLALVINYMGLICMEHIWILPPF